MCSMQPLALKSSMMSSVFGLGSWAEKLRTPTGSAAHSCKWLPPHTRIKGILPTINSQQGWRRSTLLPTDRRLGSKLRPRRRPQPGLQTRLCTQGLRWVGAIRLLHFWQKTGSPRQLTAERKEWQKDFQPSQNTRNHGPGCWYCSS